MSLRFGCGVELSLLKGGGDVQTENNISKKEKQKIGTIAGIQNWNEFTWIYDGEEAGYICARPLPRFGELNKFSPCKIQKIIKDQIITQPNPIISTHSNPQKQWIIPRIDHQDSIENIEDQMSKLVEKEEKEEEVVVDLTNETEVEVDLECKRNCKSKEENDGSRNEK
ncbi:hypothetical protein GLOIN_2v1846636 [Rhizophagus irregularis DAOM 181602=DAOM 197198]|uniref:Uncharacterized protein n=1 Tax=Rhizophagus irregularis (strain DAOM 181602 / DAOM 197198 / MUCL 43194) TaxID=747089 RepID=A0A2P4P9X0_RHIID|nr:hypothetical protein GLOIN_2v1846636 [Rhizophagus irregularis DAOM 181602=DAOM 197198]POG62192.1 hypothetical protein GLOIN_2v1846636 [Rhizophagus irregularis DAOM 181602=DAOM 197198]|eukprot:XP_025169058.1 hypothetical protein GLOIN_2v1846636 [Rhizophagus irregularis DAOM 181602=DAOM 197198]